MIDRTGSRADAGRSAGSEGAVRLDGEAGADVFVFVFIGTAAFTAAGQLRKRLEGGNTVVEGNTDADPQAELAIERVARVTLAAGDFHL